MADNKFVWAGLEELKAQLRALPAEFATEGGRIVEARANGAAATIKAEYPVRSGELRDKLTVTHTRNAVGAISVVRNSSKYADEFDYGTQARHTAIGANRGSMPPNHLFTQAIRRAKRLMYEDLKALLIRAGLVVKGDV